MNNVVLVDKARSYVEFLSSVEPNRRTGSKGNKKAVGYFAELIENFNFITDKTPFTCIDYTSKKPVLRAQDKEFNVHVSPYSLPCDIRSNLEIVTNIEELKNCNCTDKILLMKGEICTEQLMPKNFIFYNPDHHKNIISLLENKKPAAIITATKKNTGAVGAIYPYPLIEDGDFNIPNVYCGETLGNEIATYKKEKFHLKISGKRIQTTTSNVIAKKNPNANKKIIICAHIDAYGFSPGASDNASGIAALLILAELLQSYKGSTGFEIIAFNGEDHYSVAGQMDYLTRYKDSLHKVKLVVNIDDVGYERGRIAYSFYNCSDIITNHAQKIFDNYAELVKGDQWYQGDHMIFVQKNIPSIAFTSECLDELMKNITHTTYDTPKILDYKKIVKLSKAIYEYILSYES